VTGIVWGDHDLYIVAYASKLTKTLMSRSTEHYLKGDTFLFDAFFAPGSTATTETVSQSLTIPSVDAVTKKDPQDDMDIALIDLKWAWKAVSKLPVETSQTNRRPDLEPDNKYVPDGSEASEDDISWTWHCKCA
jgi:hypothetical protein